ncbi:hypothetical protein BDV93DRAFT_559022 [Ceratobasidium sp. AG-I]|nr:hypothetical protein BDV93DRAFT_559022 [Ceratobasidium sp. AG-I]
MLKLSRITIRQTDVYRGPPIKLEYLEELNLLRLHPRNLHVLLPLLAPGSKALSLSIRLQGVERMEVVEHLLRSSNLQKLCVDVGFDQSEWIPRIFFSVPRLKALAVRYLTPTNNIFDAVGSPSSSLCLDLKELYLLSCDVHLSHLSKMISLHSLHRLWEWEGPNGTFSSTLVENKQWLSRLPVAIPDCQEIDWRLPNPALQWDFVR